MKLEFCKPSATSLGLIGALEAVLSEQLHSYEPNGIWLNTINSAFGIITKELDIATDERSLCLSFVKSFPGEPTVQGKTDSIKTDKFYVTMALENPAKIMLSFCHEMIHVSDLAHGLLVHDSEKDKMSYAGKPINNKIAKLARMAGLDSELMPYERKAYKGQGPLMLKVLAQLPANQSEWLEKTYKEDIDPPSLEAYIQQGTDDYNKRITTMTEQFLEAKRGGELNELFEQFNSIDDFD
jgi:hypothetical protein